MYRSKLRYLLAILSGVFFILSHPVSLGGGEIDPNGYFQILAWFFLVPLLLAIHNQSPGRAFRFGFTTGAVMYIGTLFWVVVAMNVFGHLPLAVSIVIMLVLALYCAVYVAAFCYIYKRFLTRWPAVMTMPFLWLTVELAREHMPIVGFPWVNIAYSQYLSHRIIQIADITGVYGICYLIILVNVSVYLMVQFWIRQYQVNIHYSLQTSKSPFPKHAVIITCITIGLVLGYGQWQLHILPAQEAKSQPPSLALSLLQGNIPQDEKWNRENSETIIGIYNTLVTSEWEYNPDLIILPETAFPYLLHEKVGRLPATWINDQRLNAYLLAGVATYRSRKVLLNSAILIDSHRYVIDKMDKTHLVPFGEYVPFKEIIPFGKLVAHSGEYTPGDTIKPVTLGNTPIGTLICFESIFPRISRQLVNMGAKFLVIMTNDAWFGHTSAIYQHLAIATFRAIENRRAIARVANTGITAFIDPQGRIVSRTQYGIRSSLRGNVPIITTKTVYTQFGDWIAYLSATVTLILIILGRLWHYRRAFR